jgi:hypothetical protein
MATITVISDTVQSGEATVSGDRLLVDAGALPGLIGWELKPEGLCRGDVCVPVRDACALTHDGGVDLAAVAHALGRHSVIDPAAGIAAMALPSEERRRGLDALEAPSFALNDLDGVPHSLAEWRGTKKLLVAFATW